MEVYRIAKSEFINDLKGTGGRLFGGRWNPKGCSMLYTASNRSLAALEYFVHMELNTVPEDLSIIALEIPNESIIAYGKLKFKRIIAKKNSSEYLKLEGLEWINKASSLALEVPSILIPEESNILVNPGHIDFSKLRVMGSRKFIFDDRIFN